MCCLIRMKGNGPLTVCLPAGCSARTARAWGQGTTSWRLSLMTQQWTPSTFGTNFNSPTPSTEYNLLLISGGKKMLSET